MTLCRDLCLSARLSSCSGSFIISPDGILRQKTVNDLPVGRSVDEALRLVKAFQVCCRLRRDDRGVPLFIAFGASTGVCLCERARSTDVCQPAVAVTVLVLGELGPFLTVCCFLRCSVH